MVKCFIVTGDDDFLKNDRVSGIKEEFLDSALNGNDGAFDYSEFGPDDIIGLKEALNTLPLFSERRLILIKDCDMMPEADLSYLSAYIENPSNEAAVIITASAGFRKKAAFKNMSKPAKVFSADSPDVMTARKWVKTFASREGSSMTDRAAALVIELIGCDTRRVKNEVEKLIAYADGAEINETRVEELIGRSVTESVFKLVDAINAGNGKWAFGVINDLAAEKKEPLEIIGYLSWYIKTMKKIKYLSSRKNDYNSIAGELGYSPSYVRTLDNQAKKYSVKKISEWSTALLKADGEIKSGFKKPALALDTLIASFISC